ncbi:hypothetical protein EPN28_02230 [Patescibacteria group bacterium]|nr:MAG: hypothetical protein EPN28_02230 [Patescibacteria group bacterium]
MNFQEAYNYIISLANIPRKEYMADPKHCPWYLKRLKFFLRILGNPEKKIPHIIHVTGTSGKGSVCLMLDSILREAARHRAKNFGVVGTLTSPHASAIMERWEVNGRPMPKKEFAALVEKIKPKLDQYMRKTPYDMLAYGELATAMALYYFAKKKIEWAVLEVGCGGRYDSTNVIPRKDVAVITNIGLDHTQTLGNTKEKIAYEKAGIIKRGCQVFTMETNKKILRVIEKECQKNHAPLKIVYPLGWLHSSAKGGLWSQRMHSGSTALWDYGASRLPVLGAHQQKNAALAAAVARSIGISEKAITRGLAKVKLPIRMEVVSRKPIVILDGAHNKDKMQTTVEAISSPFIRGRRGGGRGNIHLILGFADNKDYPAMLKQLAALKPTTVACTRFSHNFFRKAADPKILAAKIKKLLPRAKTEIFLDVLDGFSWSKKQAAPSDIILCTGSIFLSGELRLKIIR